MIKKQLILIICIAFLFAPNLWAAQVAIVQTDTRQEAWAKETLNNSDLQTNIDGKGDLLADGTVPMTANWDTGSFELRAGTFESDVVTGTPPFTIESTTVSTNLNADLLDGESAAAFQDADSNLDTLSTPTNWRVFYSDGSADLIELALGADGTYLKSNGATSAPTFATPAGSGDVTAAAVMTDHSLIRGDGGAKGVQDSGVTIDDSDNISTPGSMSAASYGSTKTSGVAGLLSLVEANSTDTFYIGTMGPSNIAESFSHQFPDAQPNGTFYNWALPSGTGDPNNNKTSQATPYTVASASDLNTGTSTTSIPTPDALAGSNYGSENTGWTIHDSGVDTVVADGKQAFIIPAYMNGWNLVAVTGSIHDLNSATGGNTTFMVRRVRGATAVNMLSTGVTVAYTDYTASDGTIDTSNDDINIGDRIFIDIDSVTTGAVQKGAFVTCVFRLP